MSDAPGKPKAGVEPTSEMVGYLVKCVQVAAVVGGSWALGYSKLNFLWIVLPLGVYFVSEKVRKFVKPKKSALRAILAQQPDWANIPDVEKAEWLNKMLSQMWPYISEYIESTLRTSVEPVVDKSMPSIFTPFKFENIDLGDIPPRVGGVQVYAAHGSKDEVIVDMEIIVASDSDVAVSVRGINVGVKKLTSHGKVRVVMKPLLNDVPIVGAFNVFFLNQPELDFDLTGVGSLLNVGILKRSLISALQSYLADYMVMPNKLAIPLTDKINMDDIKMMHAIPQGVLRVTAICARKLRKESSLIGGDPEPYCKLYVGAQVFKSKVTKSTRNPTWNETFEAVVNQRHEQTVEIEVWDEDPGKDDVLGITSLDIEDVAKVGVLEPTWLTLKKTKTGELQIQAEWLQLSADRIDLDYTQIGSVAVLMVYLDGARGLPRAKKDMSEPDPYAVLSLHDQEKKSKTIDNTTMPAWQQIFHFFVHDPDSDVLTVKILDDKKDAHIGTVTVALRDLLDKPEMTIKNEAYPISEVEGESFVYLHLYLRALTTQNTVEELPAEKPEVRWQSADEDTTPTDTTKPDQPAAKQEEIKSSVATKKPKPAQSAEHSREALTTSPTAVEDIPGDKTPEDSVEQPLTPSKALEDQRVPATKTRAKLAELFKPDVGRIQLSMRYDHAKNRLEVTVFKCSGLISRDDNDLSDPYVNLLLLPDQKSKKKTDTKKKTLDPEYDETFSWDVALGDVPSRTLDVEVKDWDRFGSNDDLGRALIPLHGVDLSRSDPQWYDLNAVEE